MFFAPRPLRPHAELTRRWLNGIRAWCKRNTINLGPNSGLAMIQNDAGTFLRATRYVNAQLAVVTSAGITARVTTTAGHGNVNPVTINGGSFALTDDTSTSIPVVNFSSTTGGIPGATYVWVAQDPGGTWVIISVDCGN